MEKYWTVEYVIRIGTVVEHHKNGLRYDGTRESICGKKITEIICYTSRSEAVIGNLGLWTVECYIDKKKLLFLQKLIYSETNTVHKQIIIKRILNNLNGTVDHRQGYVPDILKILDKYNFKSYLDIYFNNGYFPNKCNWKNIVKKQVQGLQTDMWRAGILTKPELK